MNFLFVHNNFPAQFKHVAAVLGADPAHKVAAIGSMTARDVEGVDLHRYGFGGEATVATHSFARRFDIECRRAEQVLYLAASILQSGFTPDTILVHSGWGENLPLRAVFPDARIVNYCEFYYRAENQDVNFDPEFPRLSLDGTAALTARNASGLLGLIDCDIGLAPTEWQRATFPIEFQHKIKVIHEGIDVDVARPDPAAVLDLPNGLRLVRGDEVVTFVSRNLEPLRGYHSFMRALPEVLRQRPQAHVVIVGGDGLSYGHPSPSGESWKSVFLAEVESDLDLSRVHFLGMVDYSVFLHVLQVSAVHVYLTYPFVLSWSFLEAMSCECLVIGSDVAPIQEIINGRNGILVPLFEPSRLAATIVAALANPDRYQSLRRRARATILDRYALADCLRATLALLTA